LPRRLGEVSLVDDVPPTEVRQLLGEQLAPTAENS
jgi:hypothetical protein